MKEVQNEINNLQEILLLSDAKLVDEKIFAFNIKKPKLFFKKLNETELKIDGETLRFTLNSLYNSIDLNKVYLYCYLLENYHKSLTSFIPVPYLINPYNYKIILPSLVKVTCNNYNLLSDFLYQIMIINDPKMLVIKGQDKKDLLNSLDNKINNMTNFINTNTKLINDDFFNLETLLRMSFFLNNERITNNVLKLSHNEKIDAPLKLDLIRYSVFNNFTLDNKMYYDVAVEDFLAYPLYLLLEENNKLELFPKLFLDPIYLAKSFFISGLLNHNVAYTNLTLVDTFIEKKKIYYIYKFKANNPNLKDKDYMIGLTGGYQNNNKVDIHPVGLTVSYFEPIKKDYKLQVRKMLDNYYKEIKKESKNQSNIYFIDLLYQIFKRYNAFDYNNTIKSKTIYLNYPNNNYKQDIYNSIIKGYVCIKGFTNFYFDEKAYHNVFKRIINVLIFIFKLYALLFIIITIIVICFQ
jgi:hypothetical protein